MKFAQIEASMVATASIASVEKVFSRFGLVHSKLQNRLGMEKAGKLIFIYKAINDRFGSDFCDDDI